LGLVYRLIRIGLPALLEAVAVPVHFEDVDMVSEAIEECSGKPFRAKGLGPLIEGQVGCHQDRSSLIALAEDLEEQLGPGLGQRHEAQLDELRGEVISATIALKDGYEPSHGLQKERLATLRSDLGPVAIVSDLNFVKMLPKTRSGKIMRRVFKAVILGRDPDDITTIGEEGSVEEARQTWQTMRAELGR
jgi:acyl-CoA synthetase (AMP-forming)/AMP-acid ligase II